MDVSAATDAGPTDRARIDALLPAFRIAHPRLSSRQRMMAEQSRQNPAASDIPIVADIALAQ